MFSVTFSTVDQPRENGGAVYAIKYKNDETGANCSAGFISKTRRKTWQVDIAAHMRGSAIIKETRKFSDAKQMARELLA